MSLTQTQRNTAKKTLADAKQQLLAIQSNLDSSVASGKIVHGGKMINASPNVNTGTSPITFPTGPNLTPVNTTDLNTLVTQAGSALPTNPLDSTLATQNSKLSDLVRTASSREKKRAKLEQRAGLNAKNQNLQDLNNQLRSLNAQAQGASSNAQDRLAPTFAITGEQAAIERQRAVKALGVSAQIQAVQGNISTANDLVDRAIRAEFDPIDAQIQVQELQIQATKDAIARGDVKSNRALTIALNQQSQNIAAQKQSVQDAKTLKTNLQKLGVSAAQNGASALQVQQIVNSQDYNSALNIATPFLKNTSAVKNTGFSLSAGQTRFDKNGNKIASVAPKPVTTTVDKGVSTAQITQAVNKIMGTKDFQELSDTDKKAYIRSQGVDPFNFGL